MTAEELGVRIAGLREALGRQQPLVHCLTNYVTSGGVANSLLSSGCRPLMADCPLEAGEIAAGCSALYINLGTPSAESMAAMRRAGFAAAGRGLPIVLDPAGAGCSPLRRDLALEFLGSFGITALRCNLAELRALARETECQGNVGVDSLEDASLEQVVALAQKCSAAFGCLVAVSGATDVISSKDGCVLVRNGHPMLRQVTGAGCQLSGLLAGLLGACNGDVTAAAVTAFCWFGLAGERAYAPELGNAGYGIGVIDQLGRLSGAEIAAGGRYEVLA